MRRKLRGSQNLREFVISMLVASTLLLCWRSLPAQELGLHGIYNAVSANQRSFSSSPPDDRCRNQSRARCGEESQGQADAARRIFRQLVCPKDTKLRVHRLPVREAVGLLSGNCRRSESIGPGRLTRGPKSQQRAAM